MIRRTAELSDGIQCLYKSPEEPRRFLDSLCREMDNAFIEISAAPCDACT